MFLRRQKGRDYLFLLGIMAVLGGLLLMGFVWQLRFLAGAIAGVGGMICFYACARGSQAYGVRILKGVLLAFLGRFLFVEFFVFQAMAAKPSGAVDAIIVLGAKVNGTQPSVTLQDRLEAAVKYSERAPGALLVVSGGRGAGEDITEAAAMKSYFVAAGIPAQRILLEEQSRTTQENLCNSKRLLEQTGRTPQCVGIVTSDYHIFRACRLAAQYFSAVEGIPGKSAWAMRLNYAVREYFAVVKMLVVS